MRRRIDRLQRCINELETFDPQKVQKRYGEPEVTRLEAMIDEALAAAFGHGTPAYNRYREAATLDHGPRVLRMGPAFGRGPQINYDAQEAHEARGYLADGKVQSIALLRQATSALQDQIADQEPDDGAVAAGANRELDLSKVFVVHGHDRASKAEVAGFIRKLGFEPIILHERPNRGRTLITKFREEAAGAGFAVVLMTPDDLGKAETGVDLKPRQGRTSYLNLAFSSASWGQSA